MNPTKSLPSLVLRTTLVAALALAVVPSTAPFARADGSSSHAAPVQYRGPGHEVRSSLPPNPDTELPRSADFPEGWARWEFWFENEKDALLRDARDRVATAAETADLLTSPDGRARRALPPTALDVENRILPSLRAALGHRDPAVRAAAALALGNAADQDSVPALLRRLQRGVREERAAAALALGFLHSPLAAGPLATAAATDEDDTVRSRAALALGLLEDDGASAALKELLERNLVQPGRSAREQRVSLLAALGISRWTGAVPLLDRVLRAEDLRDDRSRAQAARSLGLLGDPASVPTLMLALRDGEDLLVRRSAALALGAFDDKGTLAALRAAATGDSDMLVRGYAAVSLARAAGPDAVETLSALTAVRHDRSLRGFAAVALGLTGATDAAPVLVDLMSRRSGDSLRSAAAVGLGLLGRPATGRILRETAEDESNAPDVRGYALLAAAMTGDAAVESLVRRALGGEEPREVRRAAALAAGVRPFRGSGALLARTLFSEEDPIARGAAILGLGLSPDGAVVPLLADAASTSDRASTPGFIASMDAMGQLTRSGSLPPVARLATASDFRSRTADLAGAVMVF